MGTWNYHDNCGNKQHSIPVCRQIKGKTGVYGSYYPAVHSTQQFVYLAHANVHTNHLQYILTVTIVNKCYKNHAIVCTFKSKPLGRRSGTVENAW